MMPKSIKQEDTEPVRSFNELKWVITIQQALEEERETEDIDHASISIFDVPKSLMMVKPQTYIPQQVAVGPYHLWRTDLYEMRRYKLHAARRTQKRLKGNLKFKDIVDHFAKHELKIRLSYHKFLNFNSETLAWMMALDASFLLEFLQIRVSSRIISNSAIHRDIMMLENQIPVFLLRELLGFSVENGDEYLSVILKVFYREVSPFKSLNNFPEIEELSHRNHLLEMLYYMIVPKQVNSSEDQQNQTTIEIINSISNSSPFRFLGRVLTWKNITTAAEITRQFASKVVPSSKKESLENIISSIERVVDVVEDGEGSSELSLVEELQIPSVSDLCKVGVKFNPTEGDLSTVKFDKASLTFYLPITTLDENSEVILRNLVAFEACAVAGALIFTRYTELMNGIIDTEEDVRLLRKRGIIINHLRSDSEVADLWNSMSKSVKLTKVGFLDEVIEDVNRHYNSKFKVRIGKLLKKYVYACWPLLTLLATILLVLSTSLEAFCSIYNCSGVVKKFADHE